MVVGTGDIKMKIKKMKQKLKCGDEFNFDHDFWIRTGTEELHGQTSLEFIGTRLSHIYGAFNRRGLHRNHVKCIYIYRNNAFIFY